MRNILFRGKRKDNGLWEVGDFIRYTTSDKVTHTFINGFDYEVHPETVSQYTGLTDKNGKRIFEGDILRVVSVDCDYDYKTSVGSKFNYHDAPYVTGDFGDGDLCPIGFAFDYWREDNAEIEVIGNIHDNPQLTNAKAAHFL